MRLEHQDAGQAAHPVDVGEAAFGLGWRRHCFRFSVWIVVDLWRGILSLMAGPSAREAEGAGSVRFRYSGR